MRTGTFFAALILGAAVFFSAAHTPHATAETKKETAKPKKKLVPFREDSGLITAEYYLTKGRFAEALEVLEGVIQRHPESADGYTYRGYAYYHLGDRKRAKKDYERAIMLDPKHLGANRYLADSYIDAGDLRRAYEQMQVLRLTCGNFNCEELDELEARINRYRKGQVDDEEEDEE